MRLQYYKVTINTVTTRSCITTNNSPNMVFSKDTRTNLSTMFLMKLTIVSLLMLVLAGILYDWRYSCTTYTCDNHVIIMWQSCDNHVIIMWQSCDNHVTMLGTMNYLKRPNEEWFIQSSKLNEVNSWVITSDLSHDLY